MRTSHGAEIPPTFKEAVWKELHFLKKCSLKIQGSIYFCSTRSVFAINRYKSLPVKDPHAILMKLMSGNTQICTQNMELSKLKNFQEYLLQSNSEYEYHFE